MINMGEFVELIKELQEEARYKNKLAEITREFNQENSYSFTNRNEGQAMDILLRYALGNIEWKFDCVWDFILEGHITFIIDGNEVVCRTAEELYTEMEYV